MSPLTQIFSASEDGDTASSEKSDDQKSNQNSPRQDPKSPSARSRTRQDDQMVQMPTFETRGVHSAHELDMERSIKSSNKTQSAQRRLRKRKLSNFKDIAAGVAEARWQEVQSYLRNSYRDLLNEQIREASGEMQADSIGLTSSQVGASLWSSREKDALFRRLAFRGPLNIPSLCQAVPSKSSAEIQTYITLLRRHVCNPSCANLAHAEIPAAVEISRDCEIVLESAADALEIFVDRHEAHLEKERSGDEYWLIDDERAQQLEDHFDLGDSDSTVSQNDDEMQQAEPNSGATSTSFTFPAAALLHPGSLLELSRGLFMNNGKDPERNWQLLNKCSTASSEPAIYRSAFEELYNLTVGLTRRLVQATIIQATSRLRALDASRPDWTPVPVIRRIDAESAADILNMPSWQPYWIHVARRCQVQVHSTSQRYKDGRPLAIPGTHERFLTPEEVEAELQGRPPAPLDAAPLETRPNESDMSDPLTEDDLLTETSSPSSPSSSQDDPKSETVHDQPHKRKRKRPPSPATFYRTEQHHLDALDHNAARLEELRLRTKLGLRPLPALTALPVPLPPGPAPEIERPTHPWTQGLDYSAEWERFADLPSERAFEEVGRRGQARRKRRRVWLEEWERWGRGEDEGDVDLVEQVVGKNESEEDGEADDVDGNDEVKEPSEMDDEDEEEQAETTSSDSEGE